MGDVLAPDAGSDAGTVTDTGSEATETQTSETTGEGGTDGQTTDTQTSEQTAADGDNGKQAEEPKKEDDKSVPDSYDLKAPEGSELNKEELDHWTPIFKDAGLSNEQAQTIADAALPYINEVVQQQQQSVIDQYNAAQEQQLNELKADKEFGGANWDKTTQEAQNAIRQFGGEDFTQFVTDMGLGNNATLIKVFAKVGRAIGDTQLGNGSQAHNTDLSSLYNKTQMNP